MKLLCMRALIRACVHLSQIIVLRGTVVLRISKSNCKLLNLAVGCKSSFLHPYPSLEMFTFVMLSGCLINLAILPQEAFSSENFCGIGP